MDIKATPYSNLKIFAHTKKLEEVMKGEHTAPIYIRIKPTNLCNQHCNYCHYGNGQYLDLEGQQAQNQIPWDKMQEILNDISDMGVKAVTFSGGGEPLVYPKIKETMQMVLDKNINLSIITNGQNLKGENAKILSKANWVRISLDSADRETYAKIRGLSLNAFDEVCDNIKNFALIKNNNCELGINYVVNKDNADQVYKAGKLLHDLGVNHVKFTARMTNDVEEYHKEIKHNVIEQIHKLESELSSGKFRIINLYESDFDHCAVFQRNYSKCIIKQFVTVIAADSNIYYCHDKAYLKNGIIGCIKEKSFKEVWFSDDVKEKFENFDATKECGHHCVYDDRNMLLNSFLTLDPNHINFI